MLNLQMAKKKPKNKQELSPESGAKKKNKKETKLKVEFQITTKEGVKYLPPNCRLKIDQNGFISCLIKIEEKWKAVKATEDHLKVVKYRV